MSERSSNAVMPLPPGVIWISRNEGENAKSSSEFAVLTPRFPNYITTGELRHSPQIVQCETALFWFHANLEPYDTSRVALGFGSRPHADVMLYPDSMTSDQALRAALGAALGSEVHDQIAASLPGAWMWRRDLPPVTSFADVSARLDDLAASIRQITLPYGQMGHNEIRTLTAAEHDKAVMAIERLKANIEDKTSIDIKEIEQRIEQVSEFIERLGVYALDLCHVFVQGVASEAGKTVGKYVVGAIAAYVLWKGILPDLSHLLAQHNP